MPPESPRLAPPLQNSFRGRCYSNVCKKLFQISTASNRQKHLGARGPTYPRGRSWLSAALHYSLPFTLRGCLYGEGPALLVGLALRGLDFTLRLHGKSQPSYPDCSLSRVTRADYIYFPTKPGIRYLRTFTFSFYNLHINKQNL